MHGSAEVFSSFKLEKLYFVNDSYAQSNVIEIPTIHKPSLRIAIFWESPCKLEVVLTGNDDAPNPTSPKTSKAQRIKGEKVWLEQ